MCYSDVPLPPLVIAAKHREQILIEKSQSQTYTHSITKTKKLCLFGLLLLLFYYFAWYKRAENLVRKKSLIIITYTTAMMMIIINIIGSNFR